LNATCAEKSCELCGGALGSTLLAREMMFGMGGEFAYCQCEACGCLQIAEVPEDIARYYPAGYYSYAQPNLSKVKRQRRGARRRLILNGPRVLLPILRLISSADEAFHVYRQMGMRLSSRVLDVGAGAGAHVMALRDAGVSQAIGLDPFIAEDVMFEGRRLVQKATLAELTGAYDYITFYHSLEHMAHQVEILTQARRLLAADGQVLVCLPTVTSEAFETYRENWVALDAPRHFFLHSHKSLELAGSRAGLRLTRLWSDSSAMQFMGSEQYIRNVTLTDPRSIARNKHSDLFTRAQRKAYERRAAELNRALRGDVVCAVFRPA